MSYSAIGLRIGKDKSTICREIIRNSTPWYSFKNTSRTRYKYNANKAHKKALGRVNKGKVAPNLLQFLYIMEQDIEIHQTFEDFWWHINNDITYQYITIPCLKTMYNWYHKNYISFQQTNVYTIQTYNIHPRITRTNFNTIHNRDIELTDYTTPAHYEIDLVLSGDKQGGILTFNHRASMKLYARHVQNKSAVEINRVLRSIIKEISAENIDSITSDNGKEFNYTEVTENTYNIKYYKADPYVSGQRGQNERLNRDIRKFYPKGFNFSNITPQELQQTVLLINKKHRRKFDRLTALQKEQEIYLKSC